MFRNTLTEERRLTVLVATLAVSIVLALGTLTHTVLALVPQV
ncbi:MAG: hypothetical protein U1F09_11390 [Steroidobacteraceae bacterium]